MDVFRLIAGKPRVISLFKSKIFTPILFPSRCVIYILLLIKSRVSDSRSEEGEDAVLKDFEI